MKMTLHAALTNDHKMLSDKIEKLLHELHALTRDQRKGDEMPVAPPYHTCVDPIHSVVAPIAVPTSTNMPFAEVDELSIESPAMESGIRLGDKILRCNHVTAQTPNSLQVMGKLVSESENRVLDVEVLRNDEKVSLKLRPKTWTGRGLLGCHLKPIK
jgi:26S proteasome non-ATPase regulatory subunit 9